MDQRRHFGGTHSFRAIVLHFVRIDRTHKQQQRRGNNVCNPVALLKSKLTSDKWNDANAVAGYFLGLLYPAEGAANLSLYRTAAINFLNTSDTGQAINNFSGLANTSTTYDTRVRGMVAMLMGLARFQEQ